jgi:sugar lactone lactonase YvrE
MRAVAPNTNHGFMQAIDAQTHLVYMSSWGTASVVDVLTMDGQQVGQIANGLVEPEGIFIDQNGRLWVANVSGGNVVVYPRGGLSPSKSLTDPVGYPLDVTVCPDGTAYVADLYDLNNSNHSSVQVYAPGSTKPTRNLDYASDFRNPFLTCDAAGNVFVATLIGQSVGDGRVIEFPLGKQAGAKDLGIILQVPGGIKPDNAGNLLVSDVIGHTIAEYTESGSPTGQSFATGTATQGIAVTRGGSVVLGATATINQGPVGISWSFPAGKQLRVYSCCTRIGPPLQNNYDVAFYPGQLGI